MRIYCVLCENIPLEFPYVTPYNIGIKAACTDDCKISLKWNQEEKTCAHHLFSPNDITSISNNTITGLLIDSDNRLWAYTWGVGINELNLNIPNNRTFKRYARENIPELEGDFINSACEDVINHGI